MGKSAPKQSRTTPDERGSKPHIGLWTAIVGLLTAVVVFAKVIWPINGTDSRPPLVVALADLCRKYECQLGLVTDRPGQECGDNLRCKEFLATLRSVDFVLVEDSIQRLPTEYKSEIADFKRVVGVALRVVPSVDAPVAHTDPDPKNNNRDPNWDPRAYAAAGAVYGAVDGFMANHGQETPSGALSGGCR